MNFIAGGEMTKQRILLMATVLLVSTVIPNVAAKAQEYPAYGATCAVGSQSSFTANKRGYYTWVWRTGSTVNGSGVRFLGAGQTWVISTPGSVNNTSRFGVLTTSTTFAYITCS